MYVTCSGQRVKVTIEKDLVDDDGSPAFGLYRPTTGIVLDVSTPPSDRRGVLVHEIGHLYEYKLGRVDPDDREGRQNRLSAIESQFNADLRDQGGEGVIHALFGDDASQIMLDESNYYAQDDAEAEWPTSVWCPGCHEQYPSRVIRNGKPGFNPRINGFMLKRTLVCAKCDRQTIWGQRCNYEGLPLPDVVVSPTTRILPAMA